MAVPESDLDGHDERQPAAQHLRRCPDHAPPSGRTAGHGARRHPRRHDPQPAPPGAAYEDKLYDHELAQRSVSEYVRGGAHTNGIEAVWAMLRLGYQGVHHKMSPKRLYRYFREYVRRSRCPR